MKIVIWILHIGVAILFLFAGFGKLNAPYEELAAQMGWVSDFSPMMVKIISALELLGGLGLILPIFIKALPKILIPLAAAGLSIIMLGAFGTHLLRGELVPEGISVLVFSILAGIVAFKRYKELNA